MDKGIIIENCEFDRFGGMSATATAKLSSAPDHEITLDVEESFEYGRDGGHYVEIFLTLRTKHGQERIFGAKKRTRENRA